MLGWCYGQLSLTVKLLNEKVYRQMIFSTGRWLRRTTEDSTQQTFLELLGYPSRTTARQYVCKPKRSQSTYKDPLQKWRPNWFFQFIIPQNLKRKNLKLSAIYEKGLCLQKRLVDVLIKNHQLTFESGGAGSGDLFIFVACNCLPGGLKWSSKNEHKKNILI